LRAIDFHAHIYPDDVAARFISLTEEKCGFSAPGTGTAQDLHRFMSLSGISRSVVLPVAKLAKDVKRLNDWALSICSGDLLPFGAAHPRMEHLEEELDRLKAMGVKGVKFVPIMQKVFPDDPVCDGLYEALIERGMAMVSHAGGVPRYRGEVYGSPKRFARVAGSFPELKLILAHLGGLEQWEDVKAHLLPAGNNLYFDSSYASFYLSSEEIAGLIEDIGPDKVLFGTDSPWADPAKELDLIMGMGFSEDDLDKILYGNAAAILGLQP
jgi:uncharacterized protein